jgi:hypothetical protein
MAVQKIQAAKVTPIHVRIVPPDRHFAAGSVARK